MIPQSIAYAALAGLSSQYGLYASFIGSLLYVIFGSIKEVSIGPTSLMALLTLQYTMDKPVEFTIILAFLAGIVEFLMGVLRLGFIVDFISIPVTSAFTSATSLIIIGSQLKSLLGIKYSSKGFADSIYELMKRLNESKLWDGVLGAFCIISLLLLRIVKDLPVSSTGNWGRIIKKGLWYLSISRNALVVLISSIIAFFIISNSDESNSPPFKLSGKVEPGLPNFMLPPFTINDGNRTYEFLEICSELGTGIIVVPLVAVLANVAIAKSFTTGMVVDATQEMITLGLCNIIGSCVSSMPTCGAFTRSAVSQASGVRTPMAGLYSGIMTILALSLLTPYFYYIPSATLAAVLICAVFFMIDFGIALQLWKYNRSDFVSWLGCFIICVIFGVEVGLLVGILINIIQLLMMWARPQTIVETCKLNDIEYIRVVPNFGIYFLGVDYLRFKVNKAASAAHYNILVVIDCSKITGLDYTAAKGIGCLANDLKKNELILIIQNLDMRLQKLLDTSHDVLFCNKDEDLIKMLSQGSIPNESIPLIISELN